MSKRIGRPREKAKLEGFRLLPAVSVFLKHEAAEQGKTKTKVVEEALTSLMVKRVRGVKV